MSTTIPLNYRVSSIQSSASRTSSRIHAFPSDESLGYSHCVRCADQYKTIVL
jgi:hypothetical protein